MRISRGSRRYFAQELERKALPGYVTAGSIRPDAHLGIPHQRNGASRKSLVALEGGVGRVVGEDVGGGLGDEEIPIHDL